MTTDHAEDMNGVERTAELVSQVDGALQAQGVLVTRENDAVHVALNGGYGKILAAAVSHNTDLVQQGLFKGVRDDFSPLWRKHELVQACPRGVFGAAAFVTAAEVRRTVEDESKKLVATQVESDIKLEKQQIETDRAAAQEGLQTTEKTIGELQGKKEAADGKSSELQSKVQEGEKEIEKTMEQVNTALDSLAIKPDTNLRRTDQLKEVFSPKVVAKSGGIFGILGARYQENTSFTSQFDEQFDKLLGEQPEGTSNSLKSAVEDLTTGLSSEQILKTLQLAPTLLNLDGKEVAGTLAAIGNISDLSTQQNLQRKLFNRVVLTVAATSWDQLTEIRQTWNKAKVDSKVVEVLEQLPQVVRAQVSKEYAAKHSDFATSKKELDKAQSESQSLATQINRHETDRTGYNTTLQESEARLHGLQEKQERRVGIGTTDLVKAVMGEGPDSVKYQSRLEQETVDAFAAAIKTGGADIFMDQMADALVDSALPGSAQAEDAKVLCRRVLRNMQDPDRGVVFGSESYRYNGKALQRAMGAVEAVLDNRSSLISFSKPELGSYLKDQTDAILASASLEATKKLFDSALGGQDSVQVQIITSDTFFGGDDDQTYPGDMRGLIEVQITRKGNSYAVTVGRESFTIEEDRIIGTKKAPVTLDKFFFDTNFIAGGVGDARSPKRADAMKKGYILVKKPSLN